MNGAAAPRTSRSALRYAVVAVVFLGVGVAAASAFGGGGGADAPAAPATSQSTQAEPVVADPVANAPIPAPPGIARSPQAAVAQFLAAEQQGEFATSYDLLAAETRQAVGSAAQWVAAHADLPRVTGWRLDGTRRDAGTAEVVGTLGLRPQLDEVAGLIPASAAATWQVVDEDGTWRVDYDAADLLPQYPSDAGADAAVTSWATARQRCEDTEQYDGGLLGRTALAESLCGTQGAVEVGQVRPLATPELDVLLPPFGAEAEIWGRAVDVAGPVPLRALVAPLGDRWIVVGVLEPA